MGTKYIIPTRTEVLTNPHFYRLLFSFFDWRVEEMLHIFKKSLYLLQSPSMLFSAELAFFVLFWRCPTICVTLLKHFREIYQTPLSMKANSMNNKKSKKYCEK